jgi:uncharacterized protein (TIGR00661 family)
MSGGRVMNIVYGVSGEGLGHVFEAIEIVRQLQRDGHSVKVLTYGDRACDALREFNPTRIEGVPLHFNARGLSIFATARWSLKCVPFYLKNWRRLRRELEAFAPDVFLTAYEPYTTLVAHVLGKPLVSMDNQNALLYLKDCPRGYFFPLMLVKLATRVVTFGADYYIVKSFARAESAPPNVRFVAPIVQDGIRQLRPSVENHVLVYLTKPNPALIEILSTLKETFIVYSGDREGQEGNVIHRARGPQFLQDLAGCKAIIGTTGFSLIADAIYLQKPYFGVPLKRQFEQTLNAFFLAHSGLGEFSENVSGELIGSFLTRLPLFRERISRLHLNPSEQAQTLRTVLREIALGHPREVTAVSPALSAE